MYHFMSELQELNRSTVNSKYAYIRVHYVSSKTEYSWSVYI